VTRPLRPMTRIFSTEHLRLYPYVTSSLTRGWVCRLQLLLALASAVILRSESRRTHDHIWLSQIRDFANLKGQGGPVIPPGNGFPFRRLLRLAGLRWRHSNPPPHGTLSDWDRPSCLTHNSFARRVENTVSNNTSIVAYRFLAVETCLFATVT
jgi:hypothetical protein